MGFSDPAARRPTYRRSTAFDQEPKFCRLPAGGEWIRTFGSAILIMLRRPAF